MPRPKGRTVSDGDPVQAFVPHEVLARFRVKYPEHGAISKLIRKAMLLAIEDKVPDYTAWPKDKHGRTMCPTCGKYAAFQNYLPPATRAPDNA